MTNLTIKNFKNEMIDKAIKKGSIWENFGQDELRKLKEKYHYNPYCNKDSNIKEWTITSKIDELDKWASHFDLSQLT